MGYYSDLSGEMTFSRVLTKDEALAIDLGRDSLFALGVDEESDGASYGILIDEDAQSGVKAYTWQSDLRAIIAALPSDVTVRGYFERVGEEYPDVERLYVVGYMVVSVELEIVWTVPSGARA